MRAHEWVAIACTVNMAATLGYNIYNTSGRIQSAVNAAEDTQRKRHNPHNVKVVHFKLMLALSLH